MALSVNISGDTSIDQGGQTTLTAVVMDAEGNTITSGLTYSWSASRGSFDGVINQASAVYDADFTDAMDVDVTITCRVTRAGDASPTVSASSLTALVDLGISGILVNIHATDTDAVAANTNNILFQEGSVGTIEAGSDLDLSATLRIYRVRWDNRSGNSRLILNNNGTGSLNTYFSGNTAQSIYLIFQDGTYVEIDSSQYGTGGGSFARWDLTDQATIDRFNAWDGTENLLVGIADAGSVGIAADSGSDTETVTAAAVVPLSIEQIDEQFITLGRKDYRLVIDVYGDPDTVRPLGLTEGFDHNWDSMLQELTILADEVTRLIGGAIWQIELVKGQAQVVPEILYNVVKAAPIFETLPTVHFYRGVPINFDILIQNIPSLINPQSLLISLKSELMEYGLNFKGFIPLGASYSVDADKLQIIVPSETQGGTDTVHEYPFEIESGSPPQIVSPKFTPHGNFGELDFTDPTHALGYEWTLETGDDAEWHLFSDARNVINPREVEVTPGNLNVTIKFPNVNNASSYEYMLESENHEVAWTRFTGTLSNNMITTIIPGLIEGEEYTLRLRVASPWMGPPIEVTVFGGRIAFVMHKDASDSYLYILHTGVPNGGTATRIKRILLPTTFTGPDRGGIAVDGDDVYIINVQSSSGDRALYNFDWTAFDDGERVNNARRNPIDVMGSSARCIGMGIRDDELYIGINDSQSHLNDWYNGIHVVNKNQTNGATILPERSTGNTVSVNDGSGLSLSRDTLFLLTELSPDLTFYDANFADGDNLTLSQDIAMPSIVSRFGTRGHVVVGEAEQIYVVESNQNLIRIESDGTNYVEVWSIKLPTGLTEEYRIDLLS